MASVDVKHHDFLLKPELHLHQSLFVAILSACPSLPTVRVILQTRCCDQHPKQDFQMFSTQWFPVSCNVIIMWPYVCLYRKMGLDSDLAAMDTAGFLWSCSSLTAIKSTTQLVPFQIRWKLKGFGYRSFSVKALLVSNNLSAYTRHYRSLSQIKLLLKLYSFLWDTLTTVLFLLLFLLLLLLLLTAALVMIIRGGELGGGEERD